MRKQANSIRVMKRLRACGFGIVAMLAASGSLGRAQTVSGTFKVVCIANRNASGITQERACVQSTPRLSFGDEVTLAVEHAPEITFDDSTEPNPADLVLFLNGKPLPGTRARVGRSETDEDDVTTTLLTYRIVRDLTTTTGRNNWKEVLVAAKTGQLLASSTGLENGPAAQSHAVIEFVAVRTGWLILWLVVLVLGVLVFFLFARRTGALRDKEPGGESSCLTEQNERSSQKSEPTVCRACRWHFGPCWSCMHTCTSGS